ncbi:MAG: glycosyltransferase [Waddliaceae bacterium]
MAKKFEDISILYLCQREIYLHRTSRVRFHAVEAIEKRCRLIWSGPGWDNWDLEKTLNENIRAIYGKGKKPDFVFVYKPFEIKGFSENNLPACISYNEMGTSSHPRSFTVKEITENKIDLVICHHRNEMNYPEFKDLPCKMVNISHCAEETIFRDYHQDKTIDVLLVGAIHPRRYPLRTRLKGLILKMREDPRFAGYKMGVLSHPGGMVGNGYTNEEAIRYAKAINAAKICLTCSGRYRSRYGKYSEIPACRSLLMADLPDEDHEFFRKFAAVIDLDESDDSICKKILFYLQAEDERKRLTDIGYEITHSNFTQEHYAQRFLTAIQEYLDLYKGKKIPYHTPEKTQDLD